MFKTVLSKIGFQVPRILCKIPGLKDDIKEDNRPPALTYYNSSISTRLAGHEVRLGAEQGVWVRCGCRRASPPSIYCRCRLLGLGEGSPRGGGGAAPVEQTFQTPGSSTCTDTLVTERHDHRYYQGAHSQGARSQPATCKSCHYATNRQHCPRLSGNLRMNGRETNTDKSILLWI